MALRFRTSERTFEITGPRLQLRPASLDLADYVFHEFTPDITRYMVPSPPTEIEDTRAFLRTVPSGFETLSDLIFAIFSLESGEFLGIAGLHERSKPLTPELGIWLKQGAHGKKLGREAISALIEWARKNLDVDGFIYPVDRRNISSCKIPESLGGKVFQEKQVQTTWGGTLDEVVYFIPNLSRTPLCIGHRGACGYELENSRASFQKAVELGVDWIEFDVQLVNGEWFVFHDAQLERVSNGKGFLQEKSTGELKEIKLNNGETIPTLREIIELIPDHIGLNIEVKSLGTAPILGAFLGRLIEEQVVRRSRLLVTSFDHRSISRLAAHYPEIRAGVIFEGLPARLSKLATDAGVSTVVAGKDFITEELVFDCRLNGVTLYSYTANELSWINKLNDLGVDGIIGNYPDRILQALR